MKSPLAPTQMSPEELQRHLVATYRWLRVLIAVLGFLMPFALYLIVKIGSGAGWQDSLSAYYYVPPDAVRTWFVGTLFAVGALLIADKGYTRIENWLLNVAGVMAAGVALFPMRFDPWPDPIIGKLHITAHGIFAVSFFVCIAAVCLFCADATLSLIDDIPAETPARREQLHSRKIGLQYWYRILGIALFFSIAGTYIFHTLTQSDKRVLEVEIASIFSFVAYWASKTCEMSQTEADLMATRAEVAIADGYAIRARTLRKGAN